MASGRIGTERGRKVVADRWGIGVAGISLVLAMVAACRTPTEITVAVTSDVPWAPGMAVAIQLDTPSRVEASSARVVTRAPWSTGGEIGTVVAIPSGDDDALAVRVVLASGRDPSTCTAANASGCVVVRRVARFESGVSGRMNVVLRPICTGVFCNTSSSCATDGLCGTLASDEPVPASEERDPYSAVILADRPRHYFRFDEPAGATVAKDLVGNADGVYQGVKLGVTGALVSSTNSAAYFDGSSSSVEVSALEQFPGAMSLEAWVRHDGVVRDDGVPTIAERLVAGSNDALFGYRLSMPPTVKAAFELFRGDRAVAVDYPRDNSFASYIHVVAVVRGANLEIFVDGKSRTTSSDGATAPSIATPFVIGASRVGASAFQGAIDELAVYDYPLTAERIQWHIDAANDGRTR